MQFLTLLHKDKKTNVEAFAFSMSVIPPDTPAFLGFTLSVSSSHLVYEYVVASR